MEDFSHITEELEIIEKNLTFKFNTERCVTTDVNKIPKAKDFELFKVRRCYHFNKNTPDHIILTIPKPEYLVLANKNQLQKESGRIISIQGTSVVEHNSKILQVSTNTSTKLSIDDIEVKIEKCSIREPNTEMPIVVKNEIPSIPMEDCIVATNQNILISNNASSATEANLCVHNDNLDQIINTPKNYTSFSPVLSDNAKHENAPPKMNGEKFSQPLSENISTLCEEELEVTLRNTDSELSEDELKPDISELITYHKRTQKEVKETELGEREFCEEEQIDTKEGIDIKFHNYDEINGLSDKIYEYVDLEDGFRGFSSDEIELFSEKSIKVENLLEDMEESVRCSIKSPYAEMNVHSNIFNEVINREVSPESNSKTYESVILEVTLHSTEASDAEIDYTDPNSKEASDVEMEEQFEATKTSNTEIHKIVTALNSKNDEKMDECGSLIIAQQCAEDKINEACNKSFTELETSIGEEPIHEKSENSVLAQETPTTEENRNTNKEMCIVEQEFSIIGGKIHENPENSVIIQQTPISKENEDKINENMENSVIIQKPPILNENGEPENSAIIQQTPISKENEDQINENMENSVITQKPPILKENGEQFKERTIVEQDFSIVDATIIENLQKNSIVEGKAPISKIIETCENPIQKNSQVEHKMDKNIDKENSKNEVQETNRHNGQKQHNGIEEKLFEKFIQENYKVWGKMDETSIPENHKVVENADGHRTEETLSEPNRQVLKKINELFTQVNSKNMKLEELYGQEQTLGTGEKPSQPPKIVLEENSQLDEKLHENSMLENHEIVKNTEDNIKEFYRQVVSLAKLSEAIIQKNAIYMTENLDVIKNSTQKANRLEIEQGKAATTEENPSEPFKTIVQVEEKIHDIFLPVSHEIVVENTENNLQETNELEEVQEQVSEAKEEPLEPPEVVFQGSDQVEEKMDEISMLENPNLVENNSQKTKVQKQVSGAQEEPPGSSKYEMNRKIDEISMPGKVDVMVHAEEKPSEPSASIIQVKEQMDIISTPENLNFVENSENHIELKEEPIATEGKSSEPPESICQDNHQVKEQLDKISVPGNANVMENSENDMKLEEESCDGQEEAIITEGKPETLNSEKIHKISEVSGKPLVIQEPHRQEEFDQGMQENPLTRKATKDKNEVQIHKSTEETNDNKKRPTNIDEEMLQVAEILGSLSENIINKEIKNLQTEKLDSGIQKPVIQDMEMQDVSFKIPSKKVSHPSPENHDESSNDSIISEARLDIKDLDTTFNFEQTHTLVSSKDDNKNQKTPQKMCKKLFKCDHCDFKVQRECHLKVHLRVHILPYWCSICSEMYSDTIGLQSHVRTVHHFNGRQTLKTNGEKLAQTGKKPFKCGFCNYMTSYITRLQNHTLVHQKEKLYECDKCGYNTLTEWSMERHMSEHSNEQKLFECEECGYITMYRHRLDVHQEIHSGKKLYKCDICPFSTAHIGYFNAHKGFHATMVPKKESVSDDESNTQHKCDECDYSTAKHWELLKHASAFGHQVPSTVIVPPLVRQLKCSSCNYLAKSYKDLKTHITSHTKIKPCKCKLISSNHYEVIFHNVVKFMCSVCSAVHLTHQELEKHIKKKCRNHHLFKYEHNV